MCEAGLRNGEGYGSPESHPRSSVRVAKPDKRQVSFAYGNGCRNLDDNFWDDISKANIHNL